MQLSEELRDEFDRVLLVVVGKVTDLDNKPPVTLRVVCRDPQAFNVDELETRHKPYGMCLRVCDECSYDHGTPPSGMLTFRFRLWKQVNGPLMPGLLVLHFEDGGN